MAEGFENQNEPNINENERIEENVEIIENEYINDILRRRLYEERDRCTRHKNNLRSIRTDIRIWQAQVVEETKLLKEREKRCLALLHKIEDTPENKQHLIDECNLRQPYEAERVQEELRNNNRRGGYSARGRDRRFNR